MIANNLSQRIFLLQLNKASTSIVSSSKQFSWNDMRQPGEEHFSILITLVFCAVSSAIAEQ